jgi:hypothetical protein
LQPIAAGVEHTEDDPDGIQIEEADLDVLLSRAEQRA